MIPRKVKEGDRYGRLTVESVEVVDHTCICECVCDCGKKCTVRGNNLRSGITKSCGCILTEHNKDMRNIVKRSMKQKRKKGYIGVYQQKSGSWYAMINVRGKRIYLGTFDTKEEAIKERTRAEEEYFSQYLEDTETLNAATSD